MKVLGGRSQYEVVTGLKPRLPAALDARSQVEFVTMDEYASRLRAYFTETYESVKRIQQAAIDEAEHEAGGHLSAELQVGDVVLVVPD